MAQIVSLGTAGGVHQPTYRLQFYRNGDPRQPVHHKFAWQSAVSIQTSKNLTDISGTFSITFKDPAARQWLQEMDVAVIAFGYRDTGPTTCFRGVVDEVGPSGSYDPFGGSEDVTVTGRCMGKYLQINSLFLPVWDPQGLLPTALTFGLGDVTSKVQGNVINRSTPRSIFDYLVKRWVFGNTGLVGESGTPNAQFWLDNLSRFVKLDFHIPFMQLDEDMVATALKRMEVLGFTETWVDELGRVVYRQPQWDQAIQYSLSTMRLKNEQLARSDVDVSTYVEVIPAGDPGIDTSLAQALRAGRAPVPSSYLSAGKDSALGAAVSKEFVIATDKKGKPTAKGAGNFWYQRQRKLGVRPQQITSPLLFSQEQAQAQAEGLLKFLSRTIKSGSVTIAGNPGVWLGTNVLLHGQLAGEQVLRTYYIEGVQHNYTEDEDGGSFDTTLSLTHGRDPDDPAWGKIVLPKLDPSQLAKIGGMLDGSTSKGSSGKTDSPGADPTGSPNGPGIAPKIAAGANRAGIGLQHPIIAYLTLMGGVLGRAVTVTTGTNHSRLTTSGNVSDHWDGNAADLGVGGNIPGAASCATGPGGGDEHLGNSYAYAALRVAGVAADTAHAWAQSGENLQFNHNWQWKGHRVQVGWRTCTGGNHWNHVHVGVA